MKVILINSPIYNKKVADSEDYLPPLGLGYIATNLKKSGIDVKLVDAVNNLEIFQNQNQTEVIEKAIEIFKQFPFEWRAMAHVRSFKDAEDLLPILKQCGCKELEIGIESGNKEENNLILQLGILVIVPKKKSINL